MYDAGLVLEGGGMKGVYSAGVLDFFLDKGLEFKNIYGVSAGACNMTSFISKQKGRGRNVFIDYLDMKEYMGVYSFLTTGDFFSADMCYNLIPNYIDPFDYDTFNKFEGNAYAVVTNIKTGEAEYKLIKDVEKDVKYIQASSSLPLISKSVKIDGNLYLDGGLADSIPIKRSEADGNKKNVVVMTKPVGFRRKPEGNLAAIRMRYLRYPKIYELLKNRPEDYNATMDYIEKSAEEGSLFLIRPRENLDIDRIEKNKDKLIASYDEGYNDAKEQYDALIEYLNK